MDLIQSILKEIPVDDPFLKKLKKKNALLIETLENYVQLFRPRTQNRVKITDFVKGGVKNVNAEITLRIHKIINELEQLINDNNDTILYLESTPRSGQGRPQSTLFLPNIYKIFSVILI